MQKLLLQSQMPCHKKQAPINKLDWQSIKVSESQKDIIPIFFQINFKISAEVCGLSHSNAIHSVSDTPPLFDSGKISVS